MEQLKSLGRTMYKYSQRGLSAVLYTIAHDMASGQGVGTPFTENSAPWLTMIEPELTENDRFATRDGIGFEIELADADESRALQVARLIRNSFQLHMAPKSKVRLSTGVVLFGSGARDKSKFRKMAERLAKKHSSDVGNKISFENHSSVDSGSVDSGSVDSGSVNSSAVDSASADSTTAATDTAELSVVHIGPANSSAIDTGFLEATGVSEIDQLKHHE